jgi:hypothetical protein
MSALTAAEPAWTSVFNRDAFHALNGATPWSCVFEDGGRAVGRLAGAVVDGVLVSGHSAPFGGFDLAREHEPPARVAALVDHAVGAARADGLRAIRIRLAPPCWSPAAPTVQFALLNAGFRVVRAELNQHLEPGPGYVAALRSPARRALGHLERDPGFVFGDAPSPAAAHALLAANRAARGRRLALDAAYVQRAREALGPDVVRMAELRHDGRPVAAALTYRVTARRELVVAWGDHGHGLARSPMNLLALRLVQRAVAEDVVLLDLGVSNVPGPDGALTADPGLAQFKRSVGARETVRLTVEREL